MPAFFQEDARHIGGNAKANIDGPAFLQLFGDPAGDDFRHTKIHHLEAVERPDHFAGNGRIICRFGGLQHFRRLDHGIDQDPRHADIMRTDRAIGGHAPHLGDDLATGVVSGQCHFHGAQIGAF